MKNQNMESLLHAECRKFLPLLSIIVLAAVVLSQTFCGLSFHLYHVIAVLIGLFALTQGTKVAQYDADIAGVNSEIAELEARRDALTVENAKITAAASNDESNEVASTMINTNSYPEYARE